MRSLARRAPEEVVSQERAGVGALRGERLGGRDGPRLRREGRAVESARQVRQVGERLVLGSGERDEQAGPALAGEERALVVVRAAGHRHERAPRRALGGGEEVVAVVVDADVDAPVRQHHVGCRRAADRVADDRDALAVEPVAQHAAAIDRGQAIEHEAHVRNANAHGLVDVRLPADQAGEEAGVDRADLAARQVDGRRVAGMVEHERDIAVGGEVLGDQRHRRPWHDRSGRHEHDRVTARPHGHAGPGVGAHGVPGCRGDLVRLRERVGERRRDVARRRAARHGAPGRTRRPRSGAARRASTDPAGSGP